ncbi:hypothetical protein E5K00_08030 [Hymenobacter aquaticus]|uniref:Uncharacterized protein n=1 Tax=Hymenobacter aquaticus TaxID=1867101 RepID=A0A4Z0Q632_9BACT|nr:hypothetical protein [Hymenobacter aquaticus]TGE25135.1 hypothetical protein E5K00_08030 [Hymenobacter aquaticus]
MSLDPTTFFHHAADEEKTTVYTQTADGDLEPHDALLIAQTPRRRLFVTLEKRRRYLTYTFLEEDSDEVELEFVEDYQEVEELLEDAGLYGSHDGEVGIVFHNLLFLLMNP